MNRAIDRLQLGAFAFLGLVTIISVLMALKTELYYIVLLPFALMTIYLAVINFKALFYILLFTIPFSIEYSFTPTLATDLPDEPLMIGMMVVTIFFILTKYRSLPAGYFLNFLLVALGLHIFWVLISALGAVNFTVSFKVLLAKMWYVIAFAVLPAILIRTREDLKKAFWCVFIPLTLLIIQALIRQAIAGFPFEEINESMWPFFRNHVNYAAMLTVVFPLIFLVRGWYAKGTIARKILTWSIPLYLAAIYFSYTRTAYVAIAALIPAYYVIRFRLMKVALLTAALVAAGFLVILFQQNNYLKYAPTYEETVYHGDFSQHISSTFEGRDVSSMERVYRWVAAVQMFKARPVAGFGPGNFYPYYKDYTVTSFETYVSDNPEHSTAHNYPLLLLTEQGAIGVAIFLFLTVVIFLYGEKLYHRINNPDDKRIVLFLLLMLAMVYVNLFLSDLLESDKVGPFFFMGIALLAVADIRDRSLETKRQ